MFEGLWLPFADATSKTGREAIGGRWSCRLVLTDSIGDRGIWRRPTISEGSFSGIGGLLCFLQYQEVQHPEAPHRG